MGKRAVLIQLSLLLLVGVLFVTADLCFAVEEELYRAKENICFLIDSGQYVQAESATDKLAIEFTGDADLPWAFYWFAERYERNSKFDKSILNYQLIIQDYPDSPWAEKAKLGTAKSDAMALIMAGQYDQANEAIDTLAADFAGNPDLPETLYWVAERFKRFDRFEDAKLLYQRIVDNYPESPWAAKAGFAVARADVMLLFLAGDYSGVNVEMDKLAVDFAGNADLPEALYWITERFERESRLAEAGQNYERIVRDYPYSQFAASAKLGASKAEVMGLIMSGQYGQAAEALDKLAADFAGHPDLPWVLYWIGERYERASRPYEASNVYRRIAEDYPASPYAEKANSRIAELGVAAPVELQDSNQAGEDVSTAALEQETAAVELYRTARQYEDSNEIASARQSYQTIISEYPGTIKADKAVLDIRRLEIQDALDSEDANTAEVLLDSFITDFKQHPYAIGCLDRAGTKYYLAARELKKKGQLQQARENFARAEGIWQRVIVDLSEGFVNPAGPGGFYYIIAVCRQEQKNWAGAIEYFQNVAADYPDFEYVCGAQAAVGWCYEALRDAENLSKEAVDPIIEEAYTAVLVTYPDCYIAHHAAYRLGEMSYEKGDEANAILYYRKFLTLAKPDDRRIEAVKAKLAELEGTDTSTELSAGISAKLTTKQFGWLTVEGGTGQ